MVSQEILLEYEEIIAVKSAPHIAENILNGFEQRPNVEHQQVYFSWNLISQDPDDNKFVDCYIAAGAEYLVSTTTISMYSAPTIFRQCKLLVLKNF